MHNKFVYFLSLHNYYYVINSVYLTKLIFQYLSLIYKNTSKIIIQKNILFKLTDLIQNILILEMYLSNWKT